MCEEEIGDAPLRVCIENVDSNAFTKSQLAVLPIFMASPVFALTLDTGHEHCLSAVDAPVFSEYPERLLHLHLHDAIGKSAHLPLGSGDVKLLDRLAALKGDTCLIEVKTLAGLSESVEYMKQKNLMK